jgi:hypothetical protein
LAKQSSDRLDYISFAKTHAREIGHLIFLAEAVESTLGASSLGVSETKLAMLL